MTESTSAAAGTATRGDRTMPVWLLFSIAGSDDPAYRQAIDTGGFATGVSVADDGGVSVADGSSFLRYAPEAPVGGK